MTKTNCVLFCQERRLYSDPSLKLYNNPIPIVDQEKYFGVIFDKKFSLIPHINALKLKMSKSFKCFKTTFPLTGEVIRTFFNLYRSLIWSKLDYGCIIYMALHGKVI